MRDACGSQIQFWEYRGCAEHDLRRLEWWPGKGMEDPDLLAGTCYL